MVTKKYKKSRLTIYRQLVVLAKRLFDVDVKSTTPEQMEEITYNLALELDELCIDLVGRKE